MVKIFLLLLFQKMSVLGLHMRPVQTMPDSFFNDLPVVCLVLNMSLKVL